MTDSGCRALRSEIAQRFRGSPDDVWYRAGLDAQAALNGYKHYIANDAAGDDRCIFAIADIFNCNVWVYTLRNGSRPSDPYMPRSGMSRNNITIGETSTGHGMGHFVSVQPTNEMQVVERHFIAEGRTMLDEGTDKSYKAHEE